MKREKNRLAATKCRYVCAYTIEKGVFRNCSNCREKKKEKLNHLLCQADQLEKFNDELRQECYRLEAEKRYLVKMLMDRAHEGDITSNTENELDLMNNDIMNSSIVNFNNV